MLHNVTGHTNSEKVLANLSPTKDFFLEISDKIISGTHTKKENFKEGIFNRAWHQFVKCFPNSEKALVCYTMFI